ncbi:MAG: STAS domain-containing protein [Treponema sp.]|nr:STAS domain-containing protein [Treponema sp.]
MEMGKEAITITREKTKEGAGFTIKGRLDSVSADMLQLKLEEVLKEGQTNIALNMSQVEYLCSNGIRVLLKVYKNAKTKGGLLKIMQPSESVRKVLAITALDGILTQ